MNPSAILRYVLLTLLAVSLTLPVGCGVPSGSPLIEAERIMESRPDSALVIVTSLNPDSLSRRSERALYDLLLTQARYKCYEPVGSDSLVASAVKFYDGFPSDAPRLMRSLYYQAIVRRSLQMCDSIAVRAAFRSAFRSADIAGETGDPLWIARTSDLLADIYYDNYQWDEAMTHIDTAIENYQRAGKRMNKFYALLHKASIMTDTGRYCESLALIDSIVSCKHEWGSDSLFMAHCLDASLPPLVYMERYGDASDRLMLRSHYPYTFSCATLIACANMFMGLGQSEVALEYAILALESTSTDDEKLQAFTTYRDFLLKSGETSDARLLTDSVTLYYNKVGVKVLDGALNLSKYISDEKINIKTGFLRTLKIIISILFPIILIAFGAYIRIYRKAKEKDKEIREIKFLSEELFGSRYETVNHLCDEYLTESDSDADKLRIYNRIKSETLKLGEAKNLKHIISWIDRNHNSRLSEFFGQTDGISSEDKRIIVYVIAGFSPKTISLFMGLKYKTFYTRHRRLKERLSKIDTPLSRWVLASFSLRK